MNNILSQDEVDALLKGVQSGDIETESQKDEDSGLRGYDLTSQERIVRGRMPGLEMINERFARYFRNSISSIFMKFVDVNVHNVKMVKFSEFMKAIPLPSSINIFKMEPLRGYALFVLEAPIVFALVDFFFGGTAAPYVKSEGRYFTQIEQRVIKKIVDTALVDLSSAWEMVAPIKPEFIGIEMNPQFVTIVTPTEAVIKIEIHIEIENFTGKLFLCIPYSIIEPVKEKLYSGIQADKLVNDKRWIARLKDILLDSDITLLAEIGKAELTLKDLLNLKVGDVLSLGKSVSDEIVVKVEGVPKYRGIPGISRKNQAIKIKSSFAKKLVQPIDAF